MVQTPRIDKKYIKNDEIRRNLEKFGDLGPIDSHFLKIFQIYMFTLYHSPVQNGLIHIFIMISSLIMKQNVRAGVVKKCKPPITPILNPIRGKSL